MPDPIRLQITLRRAIDQLKRLPVRRGRVIELTGDEVVVAGDLHGHVANFQAIYQYANLAKYPGRHLVVQELIHGMFRYPLGGDKSHQLIDLIATLAVQFPGRVHYLMGNHELAQWTNQTILKNEDDYLELFRQGIDQAYGSEATAIEALYMELFSRLPIAIRAANGLLLTHSLPRARAVALLDPALLERDDLPMACYMSPGPCYSIVWGRDTTPGNVAAYLKVMKAEYLVTGHIVCDAGYEFTGLRHLIVDGSHQPCAVATLPLQRPITDEEFRLAVTVL